MQFLRCLLVVYSCACGKNNPILQNAIARLHSCSGCVRIQLWLPVDTWMFCVRSGHKLQRRGARNGHSAGFWIGWKKVTGQQSVSEIVMECD